MSLLSVASKNDPAPNAFASQYISIILIIFTCIIWAYFSKATAFLAQKGPAAVALDVHQKSAPEASRPEQSENLQDKKAETGEPDTHTVSSMSLPDLFRGTSVNDDSYEALNTFLSSHDINAEIEILTPPASEGQALARSRELSRRIAAGNLPKNAAKVFVRESGEEGVYVKFITAPAHDKGAMLP